MSLYRTALGALGGSPSLGALAARSVQGAVVDPALVLDLIGTANRFTDVGATIPAGTGDPVAAWRSLIAPIATATQPTLTARPTADALGLTFDGGDWLIAPLVRQNPETIYAVVDYSAVNGAFFTGDNLSSRGVRTDGPTRWLASAGASLTVDAHANDVLQKQIVGVVFNGSNSVLFTQSTVAFGNTGLTIGANITIGARGAGINTMSGSIAAFRLYRAAHDATQRAAVIAELAALHGVTL